MKVEAAVLQSSRPTVFHGGDVSAIAEEFGLRPEDLIDFSANINPAGPPQSVLSKLAEIAADPKLSSSYPEPDHRSLRRVFAAHAAVQPDNVVVANGTAALIDVTLRALKPKRCLLPVPAFGEYRRALAAAGCECIPFALDPSRNFVLDGTAFLEAMCRENCDFCIITNPHNPSGSLSAAASLVELLKRVSERSATALLDEAFIEYSMEASLTKAAATLSSTVVLRSVTKFYALAGMRVGFAVANAEIADALRAQVPPWPVSSLAVTAASEALLDLDYARRTLLDCSQEREWLATSLAQLGMRVFPSSANFLLLRTPTGPARASQLYRRLIQEHHILVRDCDSFEGLEADTFLRVAVKTREANTKLVQALRDLLGGRSEQRE